MDEAEANRRIAALEAYAKAGGIEREARQGQHRPSTSHAASASRSLGRFPLIVSLSGRISLVRGVLFAALVPLVYRDNLLLLTSALEFAVRTATGLYLLRLSHRLAEGDRTCISSAIAFSLLPGVLSMMAVGIISVANPGGFISVLMTAQDDVAQSLFGFESLVASLHSWVLLALVILGLRL